MGEKRASICNRVTFAEPARQDVRDRANAACRRLEYLIPDSPEARFMLRIITHAIQDLCLTKVGRMDKQGDFFDHSPEVLRWFRAGGHAVYCELIGIDPEYVIRVLRIAGLLEDEGAVKNRAKV